MAGKTVLSIDIGLRYFAAALVGTPCAAPDTAFAVPRADDEPAAAYRLRFLREFALTNTGAWELRGWMVRDVTEVLADAGVDADVDAGGASEDAACAAAGAGGGRRRAVKRVASLGVVETAAVVNAALHEMVHTWFGGGTQPPSRIVLEEQPSKNTQMCSVATVVASYFMVAFPATPIESKAGSHKLVLCDVLGFARDSALVAGSSGERRGHGAMAAAAGAAANIPAWLREKRVKKSRQQYTDNKRRAVAAMQLLVSRMSTTPCVWAAASERDDLADAALAGLFWLCQWFVMPARVPSCARKHTGPRKRARPAKKAAAAIVAAEAASAARVSQTCAEAVLVDIGDSDSDSDDDDGDDDDDDS